MNLTKVSLWVIFVLISYTYIQSWFDKKLPTIVDGYCHPAFKKVVDVFRDNFDSGKEPDGAAFAVYHQGEVVIDLWGGYADKEAERPWKKDTMTLAFSSSKGIGAIVVAYLVERGYLDYKDPVYKYWQEFAQKYKENITVEMLLSHQSGLVLLDSPLELRDLRDNPKKVEKVLAAQGTVWPAGSKFGYHAVTYGLYLDKLVEKVDPAGRSTEQVFLEDLAQPYDLDMFMNSPLEQWHRVARLHNTPRWKLLLEAMTSSRYFPILGYLILFPDSLLANVAKAIREYTMELSIFNNPELREITISSASVTATARGMAKLYGILGNSGTLKGKQLVSEKVIHKMQTPLVSGLDAVTQTPDVMFGPGTSIKKNPKGQVTFGHTGHGGQVGLADPSNQLGYAYLTNHITMYGMGDDPRYLDLEKALYECLDYYLAQTQKA